MSIFDNKKIYVPTWQLTLEIELGKFVNGIWTNDNTHNDDIKFSIEYDDQTLVDSTNTTIQGSHCFTLKDDKEITDHKLIFYNWSDLPNGILLKCKVFVENLDVGYIFINSQCYHLHSGELNYGSEYFGQSGIQIVPIKTPIYRWLMDNKDCIFSKLKQEYQVDIK